MSASNRTSKERARYIEPGCCCHELARILDCLSSVSDEEDRNLFFDDGQFYIRTCGGEGLRIEEFVKFCFCCGAPISPHALPDVTH